MIRLVVLLLFLSSFFGCISSKVLNETKEEESTELIKDTIVTIQQKSDTFYVYLPEIIKKDKVKIVKKSSSLLIEKKTESSLMIVCKENELKLKLDSVIRLKNKVVTKTIISVPKCNSKFHTFCEYFTVIVLVGLFLITLIKMK